MKVVINEYRAARLVKAVSILLELILRQRTHEALQKLKIYRVRLRIVVNDACSCFGRTRVDDCDYQSKNTTRISKRA